MSKLDQLKALSDATRKAKQLRGLKPIPESVRVPEHKIAQMPEALGDAKRAARTKALKASDMLLPGRYEVTGTKKPKRNSAKILAEALHAEKRGCGRPKVEGPRPWEVAGVSRATWHRRRQKEQKND